MPSPLEVNNYLRKVCDKYGLAPAKINVVGHEIPTDPDYDPNLTNSNPG